MQSAFEQWRSLPTHTTGMRRQQRGKPHLQHIAVATVAAVLLILMFTAGRFWESKSRPFGSSQPLNAQERAWAFQGGPADTLVVYIFSDTDPEYLENLKFFLRWGVHEEDGAEYVIILQQDPDTQAIDLHTDSLPGNVQIVEHANECYDWGTFGWLLDSGKVDVQKYKYLVLLNSSVRGPYLLPYVPERVAWHRLLTSRLDSTTKLVGPVISCEGSPFKGNAGGQWRTNPHVQSYTLAMDRIALEILRKDSEALHCHSDRWDAIWYSELGSSAAVLEAGYNIASLLQRYQGVDWRSESNWGCNQRMNPTGEHYFDGITLSPHELLFVKVKETLLLSTGTQAKIAAKYHDWIDGLDTQTQDILHNRYAEEPEDFKPPFVAMMKARGNKCFDHEFYQSHNKDLESLTEEQLWGHFCASGQFEQRPVRFTCKWDLPPEMAGELERAHAAMGLRPHPNRMRPLKVDGVSGTRGTQGWQANIVV